MTRFVTTDSLGQWWLKPLYEHAYRNQTSRWSKYIDGLTCPFCVGFWVGAVGVASLIFAGGAGDADVVWRYLAGVFALNWVAGHLGSRLDG